MSGSENNVEIKMSAGGKKYHKFPVPAKGVCRVDGIIFFDTNRSFIRPDNKPAIEQVFTLGLARSTSGTLTPKDNQFLLIIGHTDEVGSSQSNKLLSKRRALATWAVFVIDAESWENNLYQVEGWGNEELEIMSSQVDIGGSSSLIDHYKEDKSARFDLMQRYLEFLRPDWLPKLSPPIRPNIVTSLTPPILSCGFEHLRSTKQESRRTEFFYFKINNPGVSNCPSTSIYGTWQTTCGKLITVNVELLDECGRPFSGSFDLTLPNGGRLKGQKTDKKGTWSRDNMPAGQYTVQAEGNELSKVLSAADPFLQLKIMHRLTVVGTSLKQAGAAFKFFGTNAYYLLESEALGLTQVNDFLKIMDGCGINVVRLWGFNDDQNKSIDSRTQVGNKVGFPSLGKGVDALEKVIDKAAQHGIYVIIALANYWHNYGGISQYARWAGYNTKEPNGDPDNLVEELFYTGKITSNPTVGSQVVLDPNEIYIKYACTLINRFNAKTNILAWELMNEPRARSFGSSSQSGALRNAMRTWIGTTASAIKQTCSPSPSLSIGGADIDSLEFLFQDPQVRSSIDLVETHLYPEDYKMSASKAEAELKKALATTKFLGKPFYLGEFGIDASAKGRGMPRSQEYENWSEDLLNGGAVGMLFWQLLPPTRPAFDGNEINVDLAQPPLKTLRNVPPPSGGSFSQPSDGSQVVDFVNKALSPPSTGTVTWRVC